MFWLLLGSRYARRPNPTPDPYPHPNPKPNPDPKPQPKRAKTRHKRGYAEFASNQEFSQMRTTMIPKCRPRYTFFKQKTSLNIPSPRLLNLLHQLQARRAVHRRPLSASSSGSQPAWACLTDRLVGTEEAASDTDPGS